MYIPLSWQNTDPFWSLIQHQFSILSMLPSQFIEESLSYITSWCRPTLTKVQNRLLALLKDSRRLVIFKMRKTFPVIPQSYPMQHSKCYLLKCPHDKFNVGKTTCMMRQETDEHKSSIRHNDVNYPVSCHFDIFSRLISFLPFQSTEHTQLPRGGDMKRKIC